MKKYLLYFLVGLLNPLISQAVPTYENNGICPKIVAIGNIFICTCPTLIDDKIEWDYDFSYVQWTGGSYNDYFIELKAIKVGNTQIKAKYYKPSTFGGWSHYMTSYINISIQNGCVTVDYSNTGGFSGVTCNYDFRVSSCRLNFANGLNGTLKGIIQGEESITLNPGVWIKNGSKLNLVVGNNLLRSSNYESDFSDNGIVVTNIDKVGKMTFHVHTINIYTITGLLVSTSDANHDISSLSLNPGIYIVETINDHGEIKREKVLINR